jgi:excisionase family DNA binding protein
MLSDQVITVEEAAERLGVSVETVRRRCRAGTLVAEQVGGQWLIDETTLPKAIRQRARGGAGQDVDLEGAFPQLFTMDVKDLWVPDILRWEDHRDARQDVVREAALRFAAPGPFEAAVVVEVPKTPFLTRAASILDFTDRVVFHAAVASFIERVEASIAQLEQQVGRRVIFSARRSPSKNYLLKNGRDLWLQFKDAIDEHIDAGFEWMVKTDLVAYYDSIQHDVLMGDVSALNPDRTVLAALRSMLSRWAHARNTGIPQGPDASRVLGNLYLLAVDQEMSRGPWIYIRYMDDIRVFGKTRKDVIEGTRHLERECRKRGLVLAAHKTEALVGDDAKADLRDDEMNNARYLFDLRGKRKEATPLLRKILRRAISGDGHVAEKPAKFSLWRLTKVRDRFVLNTVLNSLEDLAPIGDLAAQFLQRFLGRRRVRERVGEFLNDPARNLSPALSAWLLAALLDYRKDPPGSWVGYARKVATDRNEPPFHRAVAVNLLSRGRETADISRIRAGLLREHDPEVARAYAVALARVNELDKATMSAVRARFPELHRTLNYLQGRNRLPSLIYPGESVPIR